jgi:hypothetical protein
MDHPPTTPEVERVLPIIALALIASLVFYTGFALALGPGAKGEPSQALRVALLGSWIVGFGISFAAPGLMERQALARLRETGQSLSGPELRTQVLTIRMTSVLVSLALVEGVGLCAATLILISGDPLAVVVAAACLFLLLLRFPSRERTREWLDRLSREY